MGKKTGTYNDALPAPRDMPTTLNDRQFYGIILDDKQRAFRDAIWDKNKLIVFCNAAAGTGKTLISIATANLLVQYGLYNSIVYIVSSYGEKRQGYLPGSITDKSEVYFEPAYQAINECGINPNTAVNDSSLVNEKYGGGYIYLLTHTFLRGVNFHNKVIILDECQNYTVAELKKTLTRCSDDCKVIVVGHDKQCDIETGEKSGFVTYMNHFKNSGNDCVSICELDKNYRGWISSYADLL